MSPVMRDCQSSHPRELLPLHSCRGTSGRRKRRGPRVHPKLCARCSHLKRCCCPTHAAYTPEGAYRSNRWLWCTSVSVRRLSCPSCARRSPLRGSLGTRDMCVMCDVARFQQHVGKLRPVKAACTPERSAAMGEMRGDPGGSPGRLGYWEYGRGIWGTMRIHVGRSAAHV